MQLQLQCDVVQHGLAYLLAASCTVDKRERERESRRERLGERAPDLDLSVARLIEPLVRFYCHNKSIFTVQQFVALPEKQLAAIVACCIVCCNMQRARCSSVAACVGVLRASGAANSKICDCFIERRGGVARGGRGRVYDFLIDLAAIRKCYVKCRLA